MADLPIEPLFDNVLVEPIEPAEEKLPSGLVTLNKPGDAPLIGIVRAVSKGEWYEKGQQIVNPLAVKVGDKVLYRKWSMSEVTYDGKDLLVVAQKDIAAILHY